MEPPPSHYENRPERSVDAAYPSATEGGEVDARDTLQTLTFMVNTLDKCESGSDVRLLIQLCTGVKTVESVNIKGVLDE